MAQTTSIKDGPIYDGCLLPKFPKLLENVDESMKEIFNFKCREDDIMICTHPKSGTNWIYEIIAMVIGQTSSYAPSHKHTAGMIELIPLNSLSDVPSPRILNTHLPVRLLPRELIPKGCKIIHVVRNPKDVYVSLYHHTMGSMTLGTGLIEKTWSDFFETWYQDDFAKSMYGGWCEYELALEEAEASNQNILTLYYEEMKQNPEREICRIADFLRYPYTGQLIKDIANNTSFANLSRASQKKNDVSRILEDSVSGKNFIFRKGTVGDWKNWFTVSQNERFDKLLENKMKNSNVKRIFEI